jgi:hypothetical protein
VLAGSGVLWSCPVCGMATRQERSRVVVPFHRLALRAFAFPLQRDALAAIFALGVFDFVVQKLSPGGGLMISAGLVAAYFLEVVRSTADGSDHPPMPTDYVEATDLIRPMWRAFLAGAIAIVPAIAAGIALGTAPALACLVLGLLYLPGGLLIAAHSNRWLAPANVPSALHIGARIGKPYALVAALLALLGPLCLVVWVDAIELAMLVPIPIVPGLVANTATLVVPIALARIVGLLVREHRPEL